MSISKAQSSIIIAMKYLMLKLILPFLSKLPNSITGQHIFYIQDNASYHKDKDIWLWFKDHRKNIEVFNLPPYSPELNAIETL